MKNKVYLLLLFICFAFAVTTLLPTTVFATESEHEHCFQECKHGGFDLSKLDLSNNRNGTISAAHTTIEMNDATKVLSTCAAKYGPCSNPNSCNCYAFLGWHYGVRDIPYSIDSSATNKGIDDDIEDATAYWSSAFIHDGTGQIINLYRVDASVTEVNGLPVCKVFYIADNPDDPTNLTAKGHFWSNYESTGIPRIEINGGSVGRKKTIRHEFGHLLGLADLDGNGMQIFSNHEVLMGYGPLNVAAGGPIEYPDIQGAALFNLAHTTHTFTRYVDLGAGANPRYRHLCFYCDGYEDRHTTTGSLPMASGFCSHDYQCIVSTSTWHWMKCTKCYNVFADLHNIFNPSDCSCGRDFQGVKHTYQSSTDSYNASKRSELSPDLKIWATYNGKPVNVAPNGFSNQSGITSVTFESGVAPTNIGSGAFSGCSNITDVFISKQVAHIGSSAFAGNTGLRNITFEDGSLLQTVGGSAFDGVRYVDILLPGSDKHGFKRFRP